MMLDYCSEIKLAISSTVQIWSLIPDAIAGVFLLMVLL